jgi:lipopolysaccharide cholinephosphotransferase
MQNLAEQTQKVQERLLQMAKEIVKIFDKHDIKYFIAFGTLLGAVRHKGFIPWDDDFDMFLFGDSYDYAINCLKQELPPDIFVEYSDSEPLYFHEWAHAKDTNSVSEYTLFPQDGIYSHQGVSIDLYRLVEMPFCAVEPYKIIENIKYQKRKYVAGLINKDTLNAQIAALENRLLLSHSDEKYHVYYATNLRDKYLEINEVLPLKKYTFEDTEFFGPANFDSILTKLYGKYMELPKEENRIPHYSKVTFLNRIQK